MKKIEQILNPLIAVIMADLNSIAYRMRTGEINAHRYLKIDYRIEDSIERVRHLTGSKGNPDPLYKSAGVTIDEDKKELCHLATNNIWEDGSNSRLNVAIAMFLYHIYGYLTTFETEWHLQELKGYFFHIISESPLETEDEKNKYRIDFVSHIQKHFENLGKINGLPVNPDRVYFEVSQFDLNDWLTAEGFFPEELISYKAWMKYKKLAIEEIKQNESLDSRAAFIGELASFIKEKIKPESDS